MDEKKTMDLETIIDTHREEARAILENMVDALPEAINAVAGLMASVDLMTRLFFNGVDRIVDKRSAAGEGDQRERITEEGMALLQNLINVRLTSELLNRGLITCDCPNCRAERGETKGATVIPINIRLH